MDFTQKARWVKDGHRMADPLKTNYAEVVSRDSVRIGQRSTMLSMVLSLENIKERRL